MTYRDCARTGVNPGHSHCRLVPSTRCPRHHLSLPCRCWFGKRAGVYTDYIYQGPMILVLLVRAKRHCLLNIGSSPSAHVPPAASPRCSWLCRPAAATPLALQAPKPHLEQIWAPNPREIAHADPAGLGRARKGDWRPRSDRDAPIGRLPHTSVIPSIPARALFGCQWVLCQAFAAAWGPPPHSLIHITLLLALG